MITKIYWFGVINFIIGGIAVAINMSGYYFASAMALFTAVFLDIFFYDYLEKTTKVWDDLFTSK